MSQFEGRTALVTGGGGGIGRAVSRYLADAGARVVVADVSSQAAGLAVTEVVEGGGKAESLELDVTDAPAVTSAVAALAGRGQGVDILVTAHGFPRDARLADMTDEQWNDVIAVCLSGTFNSIRAVSAGMAERGYGRIITIASRAWHGNPGQANYSAAKAGVVGLTRSVAKELGRRGVTANSIAPGLVETPSLHALPTFDQISERAIKENSVKRLGRPEDVAAAVRFLAGPDAGFITGEVLHVSGGRFG